MSYWQEKVVVVTGGSAGFGLQLARAAHASGARVVLLARDSERLARASASFHQSDRVFPLSVDILSQADVERATQQILQEHDGIDAWFNCAGQSSRGKVLDTTPEMFQRLWELNFLALVRCTRACIPSLIQRRGHLINIGSLASKSASRYLGAYPASKFAVAAYSQQLRLELRETGVHVLLVCPGPIARDSGEVRYGDADVPLVAQRPGGGVKLKGLDSAWLARRVLRACESRSPELVVPGKARLLFAIAQLWPPLGDWLVRRLSS